MKSQKTRKKKNKIKMIKKFSKGSLKCSFTTCSLFFHRNLGVGKTLVVKRKGNSIVEKIY